jgi:choloylglycine hydrolase
MISSTPNTRACLIIFLCLILHATSDLNACSSFKLQKGDRLIYAHNLNEGDIGVPGLVFINHRSVYKIGKTWSELTTIDKENPSSHSWISRYGSVTFNNFGRDMPDGGMNEAGLFIWEMNEDADYPRNDDIPRLNQMYWMQYILDNFSSVEEAIQCASDIQIDGWGWHFFVGDSHGNTAAIAFIDGQVSVHTGDEMPIPALFNTPYERELKLLKFYNGFGGLYEPELDDPQVPRFVKTALMIDQYTPEKDIVDYGFKMLNTIKVNDIPEWSILFDVRTREIYFKTRVNPEIKFLSMSDIDFSAKIPSVLNMDIRNGGDVLKDFHPFTNTYMQEFTETLVFPIIPEEFFTSGGITQEEYLDRISNHTDAAALPDKQFFAGDWQTAPDANMPVILKIHCEGEVVMATVSNTKDNYPVDHLNLIGSNLKGTFRTHGKMLIEFQAKIESDQMIMDVSGIEESFGQAVLFRQ